MQLKRFAVQAMLSVAASHIDTRPSSCHQCKPTTIALVKHLTTLPAHLGPPGQPDCMSLVCSYFFVLVRSGT